MPWKKEGEEHLGWISESTQAPPPVQLKPEAKDAGVAFFLSLLVPGAGQAYCGEKKRGGWTFFFFALCLFLVIWLWQFLEGASAEKVGLLWGMAFRTGLALYAFAFLDAYFTAREKTEGIYAAQPYNPRVAAILNLVTRGFGYWYLDEKSKGALLFVLTGIAGRASMQIPGAVGDALGISVELALAGMAVDAYRLAKKKNQEKMGSIVPSAAALQPTSAFQPHIPVALATLVAVLYVGVVSLAFVLPDYEKLDQSQATISATPEGSLYANPKYGVQLHVPAGWALDHQSDPEVLVEATAVEGGCSLSLIPNAVLPFMTAESIGRNIAEKLKLSMPGIEVRESKYSQLAGAAAYEVVAFHEFEGVGVDQSFLVARRGLSIFLLIASAVGPPDDSCRAQIAQIRERLVLPY